jgi:hypothetical protein
VSGTYCDARTLNRLLVFLPPGYVAQYVPNMDASMTSRGLELHMMATPLRRANFVECLDKLRERPQPRSEPSRGGARARSRIFLLRVDRGAARRSIRNACRPDLPPR